MSEHGPNHRSGVAPIDNGNGSGSGSKTAATTGTGDKKASGNSSAGVSGETTESQKALNEFLRVTPPPKALMSNFSNTDDQLAWIQYMVKKPIANAGTPRMGGDNGSSSPSGNKNSHGDPETSEEASASDW